MATMSNAKWLSEAGHFCGSKNCRFHLHTHVNGYCVSTVGEYYPPSMGGRMDTVGRDRFYETMVFELDDDEAWKSSEHVDFAPFNNRDAANSGHMAMVQKYAGGGDVDAG
jgi:hypothetical protein